MVKILLWIYPGYKMPVKHAILATLQFISIQASTLSHQYNQTSPWLNLNKPFNVHLNILPSNKFKVSLNDEYCNIVWVLAKTVWEVGTHKSQNGLEKENREPREFIFSCRCEKGEMMLVRRRRGQSMVGHWSPDTSGVKCKILWR